MRAMCFLGLFLSAVLTASPTVYRDEGAGLVLEIPEGMEKTWHFAHSQWEFEVNFFQEDEDSIGILTASLPLTELFGEGSEGLVTSIFPQMQTELEESPFVLEMLPSLSSHTVPSERIRIKLKGEELDLVGDCFADMHFFLKDTHASIVGVVQYSEEERTPEELDAVTHGVIDTVRFIEE